MYIYAKNNNNYPPKLIHYKLIYKVYSYQNLSRRSASLVFHLRSLSLFFVPWSERSKRFRFRFSFEVCQALSLSHFWNKISHRYFHTEIFREVERFPLFLSFQFSPAAETRRRHERDWRKNRTKERERERERRRERPLESLLVCAAWV